MKISLGRHYLATLSFILLALAVPLFFYVDVQQLVFNRNIFLAWLIVAYVAFQLSGLMLRNQERVLELTFWIFTYVFLGICPLIQLTGGHFPWAGAYSDADITKCLFLVMLGILCYQFGLLLVKGRHHPEKLNIQEPTTRLTTNQFVRTAYLALFASLFLVNLGSGFSALFLPRIEAAGHMENKTLALLTDQFAKVPLFVCLIIGIWMWKKKKLNRWYSYITVVLLLLTNLILSNPISNARYWFGAVVLSLVVLIVPWKKLGIGRWSYAYLSLFLVVFPYTDLFRYKLDASLEIQSATDIMMQKGDYDAFQMILNSSRYVDIVGILPGRQFLSTLFFWIPRSIWTSKPYSSGQEIGEAIGYKFTNLSCPLWAESYINFGYIGVIVVFILLGYVTAHLQNRYIASKMKSDITLSQILVPFLSAFQIFLLRGDLQNAFTYLSVFLALAFFFTSRFKTAHAQAPAPLYKVSRQKPFRT
ncbi:oligosaccharide repeat unit polymerase [Paenibacillus ferrarius]|uniref:oligosaccharide repeat unit polymerase n=1 Tax=Paenibacillus ferrarius TaxID=1469647 RepID=UPI003D2DDB26